MFDNIGEKIKTVAKVFTCIGMFAFSITGLIITQVNEEAPFIGLLIIVFGCLGSWLASLTLYGFGQLIENSDILVEQGKRQQTNHNNIYTTNNTTKHQWRCNSCGNMISEEICPVCNKEKLEALNKWKEQELITEEEYNQKMESLK